VRPGICRRLVAGVALVHEGHLNRIASRFLDPFGQGQDLRPVLLVRRSDQHGQQLPQVYPLLGAPSSPCGACAHRSQLAHYFRGSTEPHGCPEWLPAAVAVGPRSRAPAYAGREPCPQTRQPAASAALAGRPCAMAAGHGPPCATASRRALRSATLGMKVHSRL
jgi:hypothetical protein